MKRLPTLFTLFTALLLLAAACGSDAETNTGSNSTETTTPADTTPSELEPTETEAPATSEMSAETPATTAMVDSEYPQRIVSLNPTGTEMLFAVGAGKQVIAVDSYSYYPSDAPVTDLSAFEPNIEAIADLEPDLVVLDSDTIVGDMETLGIPTLVLPAAATIDDSYAQIEQVGAVTGHTGEAAELVLQMQTDLATIFATEVPEGTTYFVEIDPTLYSFSSSTFFGEIASQFGLTNIADPADAEQETFGYPQLTEEFVLEADPDVIFMTDAAFGGSVDEVTARPGWDALTAVQNGRLVEIDTDIASRWGPRVVDLAEAMADALVTVSTD